MGLYSLRGTISRFGQSEFNNDIVNYAFVGIIDAEGRRSLVESKVARRGDGRAAYRR